jgi:hypothetical protein
VTGGAPTWARGNGHERRQQERDGHRCPTERGDDGNEADDNEGDQGDDDQGDDDAQDAGDD